MNKAEKTREFIVEKTASVFNKKGYAGTSIADITEATGLTKGSIYGNFLNKDEVALAVFDYNLSRLNKGLDAALSGCSYSIDKLLKMAHFYKLQFKNTTIRGGCPILNTAIDADDTHPELRERASNSIKSWKKMIEQIVKEGISQGEIKPTTVPTVFAIEFISIIEGGIMLSKTTGDVRMLNTCIKRVENIINTELKL